MTDTYLSFRTTVYVTMYVIEHIDDDVKIYMLLGEWDDLYKNSTNVTCLQPNVVVVFGHA